MPDSAVTLEQVLASAARLQDLVPGAVLVGGTAVAAHARHRLSLDHDHIVADLAERFDAILDHLESLGEWTTAKVMPGRIILGELGGIETGVRQLLRERPLEVEQWDIDGTPLTVPTAPEILRIKAWLALTRNQTRDYLDIAAIGDLIGLTDAARTLADIDAYYSDLNPGPDRVASQVVRQLSDPQPRDPIVTRELPQYRNLDARWHSWDAVRSVCREIALLITEGS